MRNIYSEKKVRQKLVEHESLYGSTRSIYRAYCNFMGPFHVLPDFLIIGAKKSGTTSLYRYLSNHPLILPASTKEIGFFDRYFQKGENWYRMNFPSFFTKLFSKKEKHGIKFLTGEATPTYIYHPHAPKRVLEINPNVKLIVILRNPIDRALSHYKMEFEAHKTESLSFEEAIEQEENRIENELEKMLKDENYHSENYYTYSYLRSGIYAEQLERWFKYFPREQFLIINADDLYSKPEVIYKKMLDFLKLTKFELKSFENIKKREYSKMKPETRKKLVEFFKPHNERLYKLLGTNFRWDE